MLNNSRPTNPFLCPYEDCDRTFSTKYNMKRHLDSFHLKIKRFQCMTCLKLFVSKQVLNDHLNSHSGERQFACEVCGIAFKFSSKLSFHRRKHKKNGELAERPPRVARQLSALPFAEHAAQDLSGFRFIKESEPKLPPIIFNTSYTEKLPPLDPIIKKLKLSNL